MEELNKQKEVAIEISGVKKKYKLGQIGGGSLREDIQSWWYKVRGKEDPNNITVQDQRLVGKTFMALNGVDLTIYQGEAIGIIGSNGAGKSTLLKLLCRVTAPTEGDIDIYGRITSMLEVGTGFNGEMTGRENIYMNGAILGMTKAEIDAKMEDIIEFSEVREFIDTPVKRYSSGMFIKLGFAVASHLESEIMIMDEVLAVGDMAFQTKCLNKMREAARHDGRTVLYVSHNMNTIRNLCDRCIVLDKGKVVFAGEVEKAIEIYLGQTSTSKLFNNCDNAARESIGDHEIHMKYIELLNIDEPVLYDDEPLHLKLGFNSNKNYNAIAFRIILFNVAHIAAGMAASRPKIVVHQGENEQLFKVTFPHLAQGEYIGRIVLYEVDEFGQEMVHDVVDSAFRFNKIYRKQVNETAKRWNPQVWGNVVFPTIEIQ